jgi:hypothetical protein
LRRIETEMAECAQRALASPQRRDAFEYGRMAGIYGGLARSREIVLAMLDDEDEKNL